MRTAALILTLLVGSLAHATPAQDLALGRTQFGEKNFSVARATLNMLVHPKPRLAQPEDLIETYVMLGACLVELGEVEDAKAEFTKALEIMPDRTVPEGTLYSRTVVRVFEETRKDLLEAKKKLDDQRALQAKLDEIEALKKNLVVVEDHPYLRNYIPFGAGQFQNGDRIKGYLFATGQAVTGASSAIIFGYLVNKYGRSNHTIPLEEATTVRTLQITQYVTGGLAIGLYVWSVVDALRNYQPRVRGEFDPSLLTPEQRKILDDLEKNKKKPAPKSAMKLGPMITPDGVGIGLSWEN